MNLRNHSMDKELSSEALAEVERIIQNRLNGRLYDFRLMYHETGIVLKGKATTYHAKQLAQHEVMEAVPLPIIANEIDVS